jgi:hypothetical protein
LLSRKRQTRWEHLLSQDLIVSFDAPQIACPIIPIDVIGDLVYNAVWLCSFFEVRFRQRTPYCDTESEQVDEEAEERWAIPVDETVSFG